jgi:hypothetical protein
MSGAGPIALLPRLAARDLPALIDRVTRSGRGADLVILLPSASMPTGALLEAGLDPARLRAEEVLASRRWVREYLESVGWDGRLTMIDVDRPFLRSSIRAAGEIGCDVLVSDRPRLEIRLDGEVGRLRTLTTALAAWSRTVTASSKPLSL